MWLLLNKESLLSIFNLYTSFTIRLLFKNLPSTQVEPNNISSDILIKLMRLTNLFYSRRMTMESRKDILLMWIPLERAETVVSVAKSKMFSEKYFFYFCTKVFCVANQWQQGISSDCTSLTLLIYMPAW